VPRIAESPIITLSCGKVNGFPPVTASVAAFSSNVNGMGIKRNMEMRNTQPIITP